MISNGVMTHKWLAQPDARAHHQELNGREVQVGTEFGYSLKYPGDPAASARDVVNCRCVTIPMQTREGQIQ